MDKVNPLIGQRIVDVYIGEGNEAIKFVLATGKEVIAVTDADCCSYTYIEHVEDVENLFGIVTSVEDVGEICGADTDDGNYRRFYACKIYTEKGYCLIDYRNDSNGYYGGALVWNEDDYNYYTFKGGWKKLNG